MTSEQKYADLINLPHHVSPTRPKMSMIDRAAQFSPFAALTGHDAAVKETARLTDERIELTEEAKAILDGKIQILMDSAALRPEVTFTYFEPDKKKAGGAYVSTTGVIRKLKEYERTIILEDGTVIPVDQLFEIDSDLFG